VGVWVGRGADTTRSGGLSPPNICNVSRQKKNIPEEPLRGVWQAKKKASAKKGRAALTDGGKSGEQASLCVRGKDGGQRREKKRRAYVKTPRAQEMGRAGNKTEASFRGDITKGSTKGEEGGHG